MSKILIVGSVADSPFAQDIAHYLNQQEHYSDLISLKSFLNTEFCPRFIVDENSWENIGLKLGGKTVVIASATTGLYTRDELSM